MARTFRFEDYSNEGDDNQKGRVSATEVIDARSFFQTHSPDIQNLIMVTEVNERGYEDLETIYLNKDIYGLIEKLNNHNNTGRIIGYLSTPLGIGAKRWIAELYDEEIIDLPEELIALICDEC